MPLPRITGTTSGLPKLPGDTSLPALGGHTPEGDEESGPGVGTVVAGGAALAGAAALAAKFPGTVGKAARGLNSLRQQLMLSGFALPKSMLGNAGAAVTASMERGSIKPISELLSLQTVKDAASAWKRGAAGGAAQAGQSPTGGNIVTKALSTLAPGRMMGALDEATQAAMQRAGLTSKEAETYAMQSPLPPGLSEALDSPLARYVHPFRRQPFNQFIEGWKTLKPENIARNPGTTAAFTGAGAIHGAATSDDETPMSVPLAAAASAKYGLPYAAAALLGRALVGGKGGGGIASSALPVSEYGFESSMTDPTRPFRKPAAMTALEKLLGP